MRPPGESGRGRQKLNSNVVMMRSTFGSGLAVVCDGSSWKKMRNRMNRYPVPFRAAMLKDAYSLGGLGGSPGIAPMVACSAPPGMPVSSWSLIGTQFELTEVLLDCCALMMFDVIAVMMAVVSGVPNTVGCSRVICACT